MRKTPTQGAAGQARARLRGGLAPRLPGRRHRLVPALLLAMFCTGGCVSQPSDSAMMDSLAEMEIRIRLLQSELTDLRRTMADNASRPPESEPPEAVRELLESRLETLQARVDALPQEFAAACPPRPASEVPNQCKPQIQRVVVSGDKLVVGQVERVWLEPPGAFLQARIDAAAEYSFIAAEEPVEFERDGNKWIRFGVTVDEQSTTVERPLKRVVRARNERRPVVDLRVQIGDVRQSVEFALADPGGQTQPLVLGRNFLTDVALLDVGRQNVQPPFPAPQR